MLLKLGWRNLKRNFWRSLVSVLGIAGSVFICVFLDNLQTGSYRQFIRNGVRSASGHITLLHEKYLTQKETEHRIKLSDWEQKLKSIETVERVSPRLTIPALARSSRNSEGVALIGLRLSADIDHNPLLKSDFLKKGQWPRPGKRKDAVIGIDLANYLGLKIGRKFVVMAQGSDGDVTSKLFKVRGILRTGMRLIDRNTVITQLESAQDLLKAPNEVHEIAVLLKGNQYLPKELQRLQKWVASDYHTGLRAVSWRESIPQLVSLIQLDRYNGILMATFLLIIVGIGLINSLVMSVMERKREIGLLQALGLHSAAVQKMIFAEGFFMAIIGNLIGLAFAFGLSLYTSTYGIDFSEMIKEASVAGVTIDTVVYTAWNPKGTITICIVMTITTLLASWYPARMASKVQPAKAMS
tara:strand:+ start:796 stop:2028 length:1233 start_codon:yes stop_codon:yes gene_type:complete